MACRPKRSVRPRFAPVAALLEDSSLTADIPSHDWGASAQWTRGGMMGLESFSVGGDFRHYQGDFNEVDFNTTCPGATCGALTRRRVVGRRAESERRVRAGDPRAGHAAPHRAERARRSLGQQRRSLDQLDADDHRDDGRVRRQQQDGVLAARRRSVPAHVEASRCTRAYYRAFRAPNLAELYRKQVSPTSITIPNPYLKAENAEGREVGFDWQPIEWVQVKGTFYVADYNNFNVPTNLTATSVPPRPTECGTVATCRTRLNVNKSRSEGIEAYVAVHPIPQLFLSGAVSYDDARQQSGLPATATDDTKPHINRVPSPKQTIRGTWSSKMLGDWTAIWRHEGHTTTLQGVWLEPFTVVDANVQREIVPGIRGFVSVENLDGQGVSDQSLGRRRGRYRVDWNAADGASRGGGVSVLVAGWGRGMGDGGKPKCHPERSEGSGSLGTATTSGEVSCCAPRSRSLAALGMITRPIPLPASPSHATSDKNCVSARCVSPHTV